MHKKRLGVPSIPFAHVYHPNGRLVEEQLTQNELQWFQHVFEDYEQESCSLIWRRRIKPWLAQEQEHHKINLLWKYGWQKIHTFLVLKKTARWNLCCCWILQAASMPTDHLVYNKASLAEGHFLVLLTTTTIERSKREFQLPPYYPHTTTRDA